MNSMTLSNAVDMRQEAYDPEKAAKPIQHKSMKEQRRWEREVYRTNKALFRKINEVRSDYSVDKLEKSYQNNRQHGRRIVRQTSKKGKIKLAYAQRLAQFLSSFFFISFTSFSLGLCLVFSFFIGKRQLMLANYTLGYHILDLGGGGAAGGLSTQRVSYQTGIDVEALRPSKTIRVKKGPKLTEQAFKSMISKRLNKSNLSSTDNYSSLNKISTDKLLHSKTQLRQIQLKKINGISEKGLNQKMNKLKINRSKKGSKRQSIERRKSLKSRSDQSRKSQKDPPLDEAINLDEGKPATDLQQGNEPQKKPDAKGSLVVSKDSTDKLFSDTESKFMKTKDFQVMEIPASASQENLDQVRIEDEESFGSASKPITEALESKYKFKASSIASNRSKPLNRTDPSKENLRDEGEAPNTKTQPAEPIKIDDIELEDSGIASKKNSKILSKIEELKNSSKEASSKDPLVATQSVKLKKPVSKEIFEKTIQGASFEVEEESGVSKPIEEDPQMVFEKEEDSLDLAALNLKKIEEKEEEKEAGSEIKIEANKVSNSEKTIPTTTRVHSNRFMKGIGSLIATTRREMGETFDSKKFNKPAYRTKYASNLTTERLRLMASDIKAGSDKLDSKKSTLTKFLEGNQQRSSSAFEKERIDFHSFSLIFLLFL